MRNYYRKADINNVINNDDNIKTSILRVPMLVLVTAHIVKHHEANALSQAYNERVDAPVCW